MANERLYEDMEPREKFDALWLKAGPNPACVGCV